MALDRQKTIYLIDGSSFLYRSYYAMRPLHTATGEPVQAVYNFCRMIYKLAQTFNPYYLALVWDSKGKTQRHKLYSDYKATRQEPPSDLFSQKERIISFAELIGLTNISLPGIEADDIMMSLAQDFAKQELNVVLVTSDKDMGQVLTDKIHLFDPFKDTLYNAQKYKENQEISVERLPLYFALLGDSSDNIPGVRGVGKKSALEIAQQFYSLEDLYDNLDQVSSMRIRNALEKGKKSAFLSRNLFLPQPVDIYFSPNDLQFNLKNWSNAHLLFAELGFASLLEKIDVSSDQTTESTDLFSYMNQYDLVCVTQKEQLEAIVKELYAVGTCAIDTETDALDAMRSGLVGISISCNSKQAFYIPIAHDNAVQLPLSTIAELLGPVLSDPTIKKYFHNAKYDLHILDRAGFTVRGLVFDTLIAARLVAKPWQKINLKSLAQYHLNDTMLNFKQVIGSGEYKNFAQVPLNLATCYGAADALETYRLQPLLHKELQQESMLNLFESIEQPLVELLFEMEQNGIRVDVEKLEHLSCIVMQQLELKKTQILEFAGPDFEDINLSSTRQVAYLLFEVLGLPPQKKGKTGYSTDQSVLETLAPMHPVPSLLLKYRELNKLQTTYLEALPTYILPITGKIHTTFSQTTVSTGRLSSSNPNLQNIPADGTSYGRAVRNAFIPDLENVFISADYSQIELRVLAHLSQDAQLVQAFSLGTDIHAQTAIHLFDTPLDGITNEQRQIGKRINFSILYGQTPYGLSRELGISFSNAKKYIERYFERYPGVIAWIESVVTFAKKHGYVQTLWGRRRYIPNIYEKNHVLYSEAKRIAINTVAQGTAADLIKIAMLEVKCKLSKDYPQAKILLQIHDELLLSAKKGTQESVSQCVKQALESIVDWKVPLIVSIRIGENWAEVSK